MYWHILSSQPSPKLGQALVGWGCSLYFSKLPFVACFAGAHSGGVLVWAAVQAGCCAG